MMSLERKCLPHFTKVTIGPKYENKQKSPIFKQQLLFYITGYLSR